MIKRTLCFSNPAYLSLSDGQLVIKMPEVEQSNLHENQKREFVRTIPIEDIGVVVIDHSRITITSGAIAALLDSNCALITCDARSMPMGLMLPLSGNSVQNERFRDQLASSLPLRKQLWQQTIMQKIANQAAVLSSYTSAECGCMLAWSKDVKSGDPDNLEARADKRSYADFRKGLLRDGFTMFQFSIYVRNCASVENADVHKRRIRNIVPERGQVGILCITDKQFEAMEIFYGTKISKPPQSALQLELF